MQKKFLELAIKEAKKSLNENEIPVGAVIVKNNEIISLAHNKKEENNCSIYHAEIIAIMDACLKIGNWRLENCDIYISFEPCPMCASAIRQSRIKNVYCALSNLNAENTEIVKKIFSIKDINPKVSFYNNLLPEKSSAIIKKFFENRRK